MSTAALLGLCVLVAGAFFTEAVVGFGATVLTVSFGAQLVPMDVVLPAFVPLNIALSAFVIARNAAHIDRRTLLRAIAPAVALGAAAGMRLTALQRDRRLLVAFALFVCAVGLSELYRTLRARPAPPLPRALTLTLLGAGGVVHGLFGAGGPLVVYATGRLMPDPKTFRATLAVVWCALNAALVVNYARLGSLTAQSARTTAALVPSLLVGALAGDWAQARVPLRAFRIATAVLLLTAGVSLALRNLLAR